MPERRFGLSSAGARRKCLETLRYHLDAAGVNHVWLESRNSTADRREIAAVGRFRARQIIGHGIRVDHAPPQGSPMMWMTDLVAGAFSAAEGGEPVYHAHSPRYSPSIGSA